MMNTREMDCSSINCEILKQLQRLKAENKILKKDQEFLFLLLDVGMMLVVRWAKDNGFSLDGTHENVKQGSTEWSNQVSVFLNRIRELGQEPLIDWLAGLINGMQNG